MNEEETKLPESAQTEQAQPAAQAVETPVEETPQQINWRKFRKEREEERKKLEQETRLRIQKEEEAAALKAAMESLLSKQAPEQNYSYQNDSIQESQDDIDAKIKKALEAERKRYDEELRAREAREIPNKIKMNMPDFNEVCTAENVDYLEFHYPHIAKGYKYMPDSYEKWEAVYKLVKDFVPNSSESEQNKAKAAKNAMKPQSISAPGLSTTGDQAPQFLNEDKRKANWQRMQRVLKGG